ncbi:hypothetical protein BAS06_09365 [Elizabethkingia miricola]|uniref:hypothetical protein n=1 Tax=Elizabethkingia miricola TaxID=172045 RepID=UPI00099A8518|nr:hypothetical protein [Elizabethkingia miricola]MCT4181627.1 hypothetical protein [Elizabethkingia anophelis]MDV3880740.1 hypothetical protein [Elizabethkingia anophelis]OPB90517.1 hypothetical protein BAS06_09365 [Elizabethkingia miricola]
MEEIKVTKRNGFFKDIFKKISSTNLKHIIYYKVKVDGEQTTVVFSPQKKSNIDPEAFSNIISQLIKK